MNSIWDIRTSASPQDPNQPSAAELAAAQEAQLHASAKAWAAGYTGEGKVVAVLDSGVDKNHPFLAGKVVSEACYSTTESTATW